MGILDNLKNVLGGKKQPDVTAAPSQVLREHGLDPSGLQFKFGTDGSITVQGTLNSEPERAKITKALQAMPGINKVTDHMTVAGPADRSGPEGAREPRATTNFEPEQPAGPAATGSGIKTYTVKSGDTLWNIAVQHYGAGENYLRIFEANKGLLKEPDHIYPGQELVIPPE